MQEHRTRIYRVEGIVLARTDWGEADRLVTLLTPDHGKLRAIAPGARKPASRKSGHLELLSRGRFVMARGRTFDKLTQAETTAYYPALRDSLPRLSAAYLMAELAERFAPEHDENPLLYTLLDESLARLDAGEATVQTLLFFEVKLLGYAGYRPELFDCVGCGEALEPVDQHFSVSAGGVLCPHCAPTERAALELPLPVLKVLRLLGSAEWETVRRLRLEPVLAEQIGLLLHRYLAQFLERRLNAVAFMEAVGRSEQG